VCHIFALFAELSGGTVIDTHGTDFSEIAETKNLKY
jgi:hypothetical protein